MRAKNIYGRVLRHSIVALMLLTLPISAASSAFGESGKTQALNLNAGETQVIENLDANSKPSIKVLDNPHALYVNSEDAGKLVLVGAEDGRWDIQVKMASGDDVTYDVTVHALRDWNHPLKPETAPGAMTDEGSAPATMAMASSAGAVANGPSRTETDAMAAAPTAGVQPVELASSSSIIGSTAAAPAQPFDAAASAGPKVIASQNGGIEPGSQNFRTDPTIVSSGESYSTDGVASSGGRNYLPADGISMAVGMSQVIDFPQRMRRVSIADTEVADIQVINPYQLNLIGHKPGFTTLTVWSRQGHYEERQVRIDPNGKQQVLLNCLVAELNRTNIENQGANLSAALTKYGVSLVGLPGAVATPFSPQTSISSTTPFGTTTSSQNATLPPGGSLIPMLLSQSVTYGLAAQNSNVQTQSLFQYLEQHNLAKILAQPHLLANTGEKAKFLSGGEIPIVIAQALNTSIVFKEFGTKVVFVPTVVGVNDIEMLVQPEVSQPDFAHGVQMFGFTIPAFVTRRAETLVRLRDNQTLIIAGLILHDKHEVVDKVPYLGDIPFAGGLFRTTSWQDTESDLVMSVTPQIVRPLPSGGQVFQPTARGPLTSAELRTERLNTPDAARPRF